MKRSSLATAVFAAMCAAGAAQAEDSAPAGAFAAENFSATMRLASDYRARGISNSDGPAIQGSVDWGYNGFFLGAWASNTEFSDANIEIDYYGGYGWNWSGLDFTLQGIYYTFPGDESTQSEGLDPPGFDPIVGVVPFPAGTKYAGQLPDIDTDYFEVNVGISKTFESTLSPSVGVNYHFSPDFFGEDGNSHHVGISLGFTLPVGISPYLNAGYQTVEGDEYSAYFFTPDGYDWEYFQIGATYDVVGFTMDLSYVYVTEGGECGAVGQAGCVFNGGFETFYNDYNYQAEGGTSYRDLTDDTVVFSISRSF